MSGMSHIANREVLVDALRAELVGPDPKGPEVLVSADGRVDVVDTRAPHRQMGSGEEILTRDTPTLRYGVGVLYPDAVTREAVGSDGGEASSEEREPTDGEDGTDRQEFLDAGEDEIERVAERFDRGRARADEAAEEPSLSGANDRRPSAMAVSMLVDLSGVSEVRLTISGGRYTARTVDPATAADSKSWKARWWLRSPVERVVTFATDDVVKALGSRLDLRTSSGDSEDPLVIDAFCVVREHEPGRLLLTVGIVNRTPRDGGGARSLDWPAEACLFQTGFTVDFEGSAEAPVLPYPQRDGLDLDEEEWSLELLYRSVQTFAIGHGCSADWESVEGASVASAVRSECLPSFETPSITPNIIGPDGEPIHVPMAPLAGLVHGNDGMAGVERILDGYEAWIATRRSVIDADLVEELRPHAKRHLDECDRALRRMRAGVEFLRADPVGRRAFELANRAILLQQVRAGSPTRLLEWDKGEKRLRHTAQRVVPETLSPKPGRGQWRPFQIAFLLAAVESTALPDHSDRPLVDLIFFPTGGGKTEAYLALAAFSIFYRRLSDPTDDGTDVLMRYTLRLLTAQQFQRAAALVCAMEIIRADEPEDFGTPFSLGIWVGGSVTPNDKASAVRMLKDLNRSDGFADNGFLVTKCPWCAAQIGPVEYRGKRPKFAPSQVGYEQVVDSVMIRCTDSSCEFSTGLPLRVIDEEIYEHRPDIVIGTVDKFARLIWRSDTRSLFGVGDMGERRCSPPGLIIQDELHLISGPLGSMVGMFETVIDALCRRDAPDGTTAPPKIVSSTATIRRYAEQTLALFGRTDVALFPPRGIDASDSYFATYARDADGALRAGRRYVGILGTSLGSHQTAQIRTAATVLQAANMMGGPEAADPWWTLLSFFNSLRELGGGLSLYNRDIKEYMWTQHLRSGLPNDVLRSFHRVEELTSRIRNQEVPDRLAQLEVTTTDPDQTAVDACLATSIIEVGVDIDRLSVMAIIGQPKTTAQYIQVSGRVGRRWEERPGLILTVYSPAKARDRSHYEKFRSYHERLYAQVEPTSVTPFAPPVQSRGIHALLIAYVRQFGPKEQVATPWAVPAELVEAAKEVIERRVAIVDPDERSSVLRMLDRRADEWRRSGATSWERSDATDEDFLIRPGGEYIEPKLERKTWALPTSLRDVDAGCEAVITSHYSAHGIHETDGLGSD